MPHLVTAIIKPFKLDEVKAAVEAAGFMGMTTAEVRGYGRQGGKTETFRGSEYRIDFIPKVRIEVIVPDSELDRLIDTIAEAAQTGKIGDGKIWAVELPRLRRVRTGEVGDEAV